MIELGSEALFSSGVSRRGKRAADITGDYARGICVIRAMPIPDLHRESAAFPIGHRLFRAQTIEIDRDVNGFAGEFLGEAKETPLPILPNDRAATLARRGRAIVGPRSNFKRPSRSAPGSQKYCVATRFQNSRSPIRSLSHVRKFERAIHPAAAAPFRRTNVPIGMIVE